MRYVSHPQIYGLTRLNPDMTHDECSMCLTRLNPDMTHSLLQAHFCERSYLPGVFPRKGISRVLAADDLFF